MSKHDIEIDIEGDYGPMCTDSWKAIETSETTDDERGCSPGSPTAAATSNGPLICDQCSKPFRTLDELSAHVQLHPCDRSLHCQYCDKAFRQMSTLTAHTRTHTGERPYPCPVCNKSFTQKGGLVVHMRLHSGEKPFACDACGKRFTQKAQLMSHAERFHPHDVQAICYKPRKRSLNSSLPAITRSTSPYQPYLAPRRSTPSADGLHRCEQVPVPHSVKWCGTAPQCGKCFMSDCALKTHFRTHTGERPFKCDYCHKSFIQKGHLKVHSMLHTGEKPFKCDQCGEAFRQNQHLRQHLQLHTGERAMRTFACTVCGLRFQRRGELSEHKYEHTLPSPLDHADRLPCDRCGMSFGSGLGCHQVTAHGPHAKMFQCGRCDASFQLIDSLKRHVANAHDEALESFSPKHLDIEDSFSYCKEEDEEPDILS